MILPSPAGPYNERTVKIGIVGAGSACFSLSLVKDVCLARRLRGSTVCLMDIDPVRLEIAHGLSRRFASELGASIRLEKTLSRRRCLEGADFVVDTALSAGGSHRNLRRGWAIARRLGYRIGGSLHVMHDEAFWVNFHQFRLMESLTRDILATCPKAWLLLVANPVFAGTTLLGRKYPRARVVGLCHGFGGLYSLANRVGLKDPGQISFEVAGVNHFIWLTGFRYRGRDAYPAVDRWLKRKGPAFWRSSRCGTGDEAGPKKADLYRRYGAWPVGDTAHVAGGGWPSWYYSSRVAERRWKEDGMSWWAGHFRGVAREPRRIGEIVADRKTSLVRAFGGEPSGEQMIPLIECLAYGVSTSGETPRPSSAKRFVVNIPNRGGFVPGIPADVAVEIPAWADRGGIHGIRTSGLPPAVLVHTLRDLVGTMEMELLAYGRGDRGCLRELVMTDPWTRFPEQADRLVDRILAMPSNEALRRHYRGQGRG